jgi:hypothetical protein
MTAAQALLLGYQIFELAAAGIPRALAAAETVKRLAAERRDPTPAEWAELQEVTDALHARVQAAAGGGEA